MTWALFTLLPSLLLRLKISQEFQFHIWSIVMKLNNTYTVPHCLCSPLLGTAPKKVKFGIKSLIHRMQWGFIVPPFYNEECIRDTQFFDLRCTNTCTVWPSENDSSHRIICWESQELKHMQNFMQLCPFDFLM